jgi:OOP family OmpA-OmpF porin
MNIKNNSTLYLVFFIFLATFTQNQKAFAQDVEKNYNRWSVNLNGGINIGIKPFTEGYYTTTPNYFQKPDFNHVDFNVRKMFNTKFGLRWDFAYDNFSAENGSPYFSNNLYRTSIQGVLNIHRAFNWEEFTDTFGLQFHFGPGLSFLEGPDTTTFNAYDNIFSVLGGATVLIKASDKLAFNLDFTMISNLTHHIALDGQSRLDPSFSRTGSIYTSSIGLTYYLGKKDKHADWYSENGKDRTDQLLARIEEIETLMIDADRDGVPDYLDTEYFTISGDTNYSNEEMRSMINSQYINVFFVFNESNITKGSASAINFLVKYLNANPNSKAEVIGYADEFGNLEYNMILSRKRAEKVIEIIVSSGIDPNRLELVLKREDKSASKDSKLATQLARKVDFKVD